MWKIVPAGVVIFKPFGSIIEWVKVTKSILKGSSLTVPFNWTICKKGIISIFFSLNFSVTRDAVNGVAYILHLNFFQT